VPPKTPGCCQLLYIRAGRILPLPIEGSNRWSCNSAHSFGRSCDILVFGASLRNCWQLGWVNNLPLPQFSFPSHSSLAVFSCPWESETRFAGPAIVWEHYVKLISKQWPMETCRRGSAEINRHLTRNKTDFFFVRTKADEPAPPSTGAWLSARSNQVVTHISYLSAWNSPFSDHVLVSCELSLHDDSAPLLIVNQNGAQHNYPESGTVSLMLYSIHGNNGVETPYSFSPLFSPWVIWCRNENDSMQPFEQSIRVSISRNSVLTW